MNGVEHTMNCTPMRVLIVDDEPIARAGMIDLVSAHPHATVVGEASGGRQAVEMIGGVRPDIVVLDVEMPVIDGFEVAAALPVEDTPELIFVTAHEDCALRGFQARAVDYVLKPYSAERFRVALARAIQRRRDRLSANRYRHIMELLAGSETVERHSKTSPPFAERLMVHVGARGIVLSTDAVTLLRADGACVTVCTGSTAYTLRESLQTLEHRLDPRQFLRVHRSAIVRIDAVRVAERHTNDRVVLVLDGDVRVPVSRARREAVMHALAPIRG